jgi:ubiquinone/menaquinone biosynthesis C-methylase UbiE
MNDDRAFAGSIPALYERLLVPLIFQPYADDLAQRVYALAPARVLEIAAGTGVATRAIAAMLPAASELVATDLNQAMLDEAARHPVGRAVEWRQADAMALPFADARFDAVVCQFGAMFFPDRVHAYGEFRRVLAPGGRLLFNTWDAIGHNEFADEVTRALAGLFTDNPPRFLARTPHGYHDPARIRADVEAAGFRNVEIQLLSARSRAGSAREAAVAYCQGTPLRGELEAIGPQVMAQATDAAEAAIAARFGDGAVDGRIQALVVSASN